MGPPGATPAASLRRSSATLERGATPLLTRERSALIASTQEGGTIPFNNIISRADALPLIPEEIATEVIKAAAAESAALSLFRRVNMGSQLSTLPVLSALAQAYFVNGDTGLKQTTEM